MTRLKRGGNRGRGQRRTAARAWFFAGGLVLSLSALPGVQAAPVPFARGDVLYDLQDEPLRTFLQRFFEDQGIPVVLSDAVRSQQGGLNGPRNGPPAKVFSSILDSNQLASYYDGSTVFIYKLNEIGTRSFAVPPERVAEFRRQVRNLDLLDRDNSLRVSGDSGIVVANGTPRFLEQVVELAQTVNATRGEAVKTTFRFIPLKYAWAGDTTFTVGNKQVTVPGVATLLKQLVDANGGSDSGFATSREQVSRPSARRLRGTGLASVGQPPFPPPGRAGYDDGSADAPVALRPNIANSVNSSDAGNSRIVADVYHNAIIVRDTPDRIPMYDDLVRALDVETQVVEIEATIIDVDENKLRDLGIDWRYASNRNEVLFGGTTNATLGDKTNFLNALAGNNVAQLGQIPGFQVGTIIGDSTRFIARVNALEQQSIMKVVTRPQVITLNDVEAVIESIRELYIPVSGTYDQDLFNVNAGTVLRVTPHAITDGNRQRLRLLVSIEDGTVTLQPSSNANSQNADIPTVTRNAVNTQAVIENGQSLLLGGLVRSEDLKTTNKVPLLGNIPLIGGLFRNESKTRDRMERLFLISPRLTPLNRITGQQSALELPVPPPPPPAPSAYPADRYEPPKPAPEPAAYSAPVQVPAPLISADPYANQPQLQQRAPTVPANRSGPVITIPAQTVPASPRTAPVPSTGSSVFDAPPPAPIPAPAAPVRVSPPAPAPAPAPPPPVTRPVPSTGSSVFDAPAPARAPSAPAPAPPAAPAQGPTRAVPSTGSSVFDPPPAPPPEAPVSTPAPATAGNSVFDNPAPASRLPPPGGSVFDTPPRDAGAAPAAPSPLNAGPPPARPPAPNAVIAPAARRPASSYPNVKVVPPPPAGPAPSPAPVAATPTVVDIVPAETAPAPRAAAPVTAVGPVPAPAPPSPSPSQRAVAVQRDADDPR